jgi:hypothetical protein
MPTSHKKVSLASFVAKLVKQAGSGTLGAGLLMKKYRVIALRVAGEAGETGWMGSQAACQAA